MAGKRTRGTLDACACPWCGKANDFRDALELVEVGNSFKCDECGRQFTIAATRPVTNIWLRRG